MANIISNNKAQVCSYIYSAANVFTGISGYGMYSKAGLPQAQQSLFSL